MWPACERKSWLDLNYLLQNTNTPCAKNKCKQVRVGIHTFCSLVWQLENEKNKMMLGCCPLLSFLRVLWFLRLVFVVGFFARWKGGGGGGINHLNEENGRDELADPREWQKKKGGKRGEWRDRRTKLTAFFPPSARSLLSPSDSRLRSTGRWVLLRHFSQYFTVCPFIPFSSTLISPLTTFIQPSPAWGITFTYTYLLVLYNGVWKAEFDWPLGGWIRCLFHPPHLLSSCSLSLPSVRRKGFRGGLRTN